MYASNGKVVNSCVRKNGMFRRWGSQIRTSSHNFSSCIALTMPMRMARELACGRTYCVPEGEGEVSGSEAYGKMVPKAAKYVVRSRNDHHGCKMEAFGKHRSIALLITSVMCAQSLVSAIPPT